MGRGRPTGKRVDLAKGVPLLVRSGQNQLFVVLKKR